MEPNIQILLVEDDYQDAEYISEILNFPNVDSYNLQVAERLDDAINLASSSTFDIILTDLNLPDSQGLNSFQRLLESYPPVPIVVLTGLSDTETGKKAVQKGAQDYLVKSEIKGDTLKRALTYAIERKKIKDALEETNSLKELLLDVITHDLKNNAGSIFGLSNILHGQDPENEIVCVIKDASERLLKVIDNASTLAKISSGEEIELMSLDLCQIVADVIDEYSDTIRANNMEVEYTPCGEEIINVNPIISEVFKNFISNAIRHASKGKRIKIGLESDHNRVLARVSDLGDPIPEEKREIIFQRKVQLNGDGNTGTGLGLAIVKRIAEMHHGRVWVEPYAPRGNSFCFELIKN